MYSKNRGSNVSEFKKKQKVRWPPLAKWIETNRGQDDTRFHHEKPIQPPSVFKNCCDWVSCCAIALFLKLGCVRAKGSQRSDHFGIHRNWHPGPGPPEQ